MITSTPRSRRPRYRIESELKKVGVMLFDESYIRLGCKQYGRQWTPMLRQDGRLPRGYWPCP